MYGSKSDKARISESDRSYDRYVKQYNRRPQQPDDSNEQILAMLDDNEPAIMDGFVMTGRITEIDRLHAEALEYNAMVPWEREMLLDTRDFWTDVQDVADALDEEGRREAEARYDSAYGGYSDDTYEEDMETVVDCWIPFMRLPELRDTFGENWLGNGFHIVQGNGVRPRG